MRTIGQITRRAALAAVGIAGLAACSDPGQDENLEATGDAHDGDASDSGGGSGHGDASDQGGAHDDHEMDGGRPPDGIAEAADPTYPVGTAVIVTADHMPGMEGAQATVSGAFDTTTYSVSYTPPEGGEPVADHKWVVHEELDAPGETPLAEGTEVVLDAEHMPGMDGAEATIDSSTQETVYMVDLDMDGSAMTNHKWVVESELEPAA